MPEQEHWTIGRLLQWTADYLKKSGSASPRLDAEVLLSDARGCQRIELYTAFDQEPSEAVRNRFRDMVRRRAAGEPVAYLVGRREFFSLMFRVTPDVLIPRPETEFVVLGALDWIKQRSGNDGPVMVADVGTGSGAIAVSIARHAPGCRVIATDVSQPALEVARQNALDHQVADRIEFVQCDLLGGIDPQRQMDLIASNPPYVAEAELATLENGVRRYEPRGALVAGATGTDVVARLIRESCDRLRPGGGLLIEISPMIEGKVRELFAEEPRWSGVSVSKDLAGLSRVVSARWE
jgi:release factor glutamine methyltransferase